MINKKRHFTLLEILVVVFIISLGAVITGVKVKELYLEQRYLSESQQVLSHLNLAQDLMLIMNADVKLKMSKDLKKEKIVVWLDIEKPLKAPWDRFVERKIELSAIKSFEFGGVQEDDLVLNFSFGKMSQGTLTLYKEDAKNGTKSEKMDPIQMVLPGYPRPLTVKSSDQNEKDQANQSHSLYPVEVYEKLYADPNKKNEKTS